MKTMIKTITTATLVASLLSGTVQADSAGDIESAGYDAPVSISINFMYHTEMDMHEQDVFIEREPGSGQVWRVTKADQDWNAPLFSVARPVKHNPFDGSDAGPYPRGEALGMTLGEWFAEHGINERRASDGNLVIHGNVSPDFQDYVEQFGDYAQFAPTAFALATTLIKKRT